VLTLGRNSSRANVLASDEELARRGVELHETNRGGDVTYHGPGQLVGYPIFDLRGDLPGKKGPHLGPVDFVRLIEEVLIRACGEFGVMAQRVPKRTGVWTIAGGSVQEKKIAAIGVTTDLRDFQWIVPCGIADREVTSLEVEAERVPTMEEAGDAVARSFGRVFERQMLGVGSVEELVESQPHDKTE
jgi:lipoyl(octanoyl) transferase